MNRSCLAYAAFALLAACPDSSESRIPSDLADAAVDVPEATGPEAAGPEDTAPLGETTPDETATPETIDPGAPLTVRAHAVDTCGSFVPEHQSGVNYQTPTSLRARVMAVELLRHREDPAPLALPLASPIVDVDLSAGGVLATAPTGALPPGTFGYAKITVASVRYDVQAVPRGFLAVPVPVTVDMALSNHTTGGVMRGQGQYTVTLATYVQSGTTPLNCLLSAWGGAPSTAGGTFTVTVPLPGGPLELGALAGAAGEPLTVSLDFPMRDAFSWRDLPDTGFAEGLYDLAMPPARSELPDAFAECHLFMADRCVGEAVVPYHPSWPMPDSAPLFCTDGAKLVDPCPSAGAPGFGQDASYRVQPLAYDAADGAVADLVTGLGWQQATPVTMYTWWDARDYCAGLALAGHDDWRLPSRIELVSILDFGRLDPVIDPVAFPGTPSDFYWTASPVPFLSFAYGVRFELGFIYDHDPHSTGRVRCVRGGYVAPSPRFTLDVQAGTARDNGTGLLWERDTLDTALGWLDALAHCEALSLAGHDDWRLPTLKETQTLIDERRLQPSIDIAAFPDTPSEWYWSSTPISTHPNEAWATSTTDGYASIHAVAEQHRVRCVR